MSSGDNPTASPGPGPGPAPAADSNNPLRIAIVGGAIGGLSAALLIDHFCRTRTHTRAVAIDVYEQAPAYQEIGAGVGLGLNATKLLHLVPGLGPRLNAIQGDHVDSWVTHVRYDNGQRITNAHGPVRGPPKQVRPLTVARSEFLDVLLGAIRERGVARLHTGKRLTAVEVRSSLFSLFFLYLSLFLLYGWLTTRHKTGRTWARTTACGCASSTARQPTQTCS